MSAIKKFFQKKKLDVKFKQAGQGHTLSESQGQNNHSNAGPSACSASSSSAGRKRLPSSEEASRSAAAALARLDSAAKPNRKPTSATATWKTPISDMQQLKAQVNQEMDREQHATPPKQDEQFESSPSSAGIAFACPICPVCLPEDKIIVHIEECLYREIDSEPGMIAASMIHTLNAHEKVQPCIDVLNKYFENIIKHPDEEKYRKIKQSNKVFKERVAPLKGVKELVMLGAGFVDVKLPNEEGKEESFYILSEGLAMDTERLVVIQTYINGAEPLVAGLDRNVRIFEPATITSKLHVGDDFYRLSNDEIKKQHQSQVSAVQKNKQLRTKAMRDEEDLPAKRCYRFTLVRVRFPDGNILEGTFYSKDLFSEVEQFVKESIEFDWLPFDLFNASGKKLKSQPDKTLQSLELSPAAILNFKWDADIAADVKAANGKTDQYLTGELLARKMTLT